jgi:hypothetical protein
MTYTSHMTTQSSHMVPTAPLSCLMTPIWYILCTEIQHGAETAPIWIIRLHQGIIHLPCGTIWFPYGEHGSNMAHSWFSRCTFGSHLPYGSHTVHEGLPYSACGSHGHSSRTVLAAPTWCTILPSGSAVSSNVHMALIWPHLAIQLPYDPIHLPHGAIWLPCGTTWIP